MGGGMFGMGGQPQPKGDIRALWNALGIQVTGDDGRRHPPTCRRRSSGRTSIPIPSSRAAASGRSWSSSATTCPGATNAFNPKEPVCREVRRTAVSLSDGHFAGDGQQAEVHRAGRDQRDHGGNDRGERLADRRERPVSAGREARQADQGGSSCWPPGFAAKKPRRTRRRRIRRRSQGRLRRPTAATARQAQGDQRDLRGRHRPVAQRVRAAAERAEHRRSISASTTCRSCCNVIDAVAGDDRFLEIRKRKPRHSTLKTVEARAAEGPRSGRCGRPGGQRKV